VAPVATLLGKQRLAAGAATSLKVLRVGCDLRTSGFVRSWIGAQDAPYINGYAMTALFVLMPAASRRAAALSVRSQVKAASVRPKWP
jgi:hypothetical protein